MKDGLDDGTRQSTVRSWALPTEIRFLLDHGLPFALLDRAASVSVQIGVSTEALLFAAGAIDEESYYRALAHELGLPFTLRARLSDKARFPESIQAGIAPLAGPAGGYLLAPRGTGLIRLLQQRRSFGCGVAVTTPTRLQREVLRVKAKVVAYQAAHALPDWRADLSARGRWTWGQMGGFCALLLILLLSISFGPTTPVTALAVAASPLFLGMVVTRLAACLLANPVEPAIPPLRLKDSALPSYTVIVALYREAPVIGKLVRALLAIAYPRSKLDIKLVIEADDRETQAALAAISLPAHMEIVVAPPGFPRTKPRALNVALPLARGELTVVYDAEDEPDPGQLRLAAAYFKNLPPEVACLQARLTIDNTHDTWLTRMFTIEYAALFDVFNPGLASMGCPIPLGGTSNHFRTRTLRAICGWDAWNVTEDADLGIRLARLGYDVVDLPSSTFEEAPVTLPAWMRQRTRWMKGFIQTCTSHSRRPLHAFRQLGFWRGYGAMTVTLGTVLSALGYPFFTAFVFVVWSAESLSPWLAAWRSFSGTLFVLGIAAIYVPAFIALARRRLWSLLPWILLLPAYYLLVSVAAWRALWESATAPFRWNKTDHGFARTTRNPRLRSTMPARREPYR